MALTAYFNYISLAYYLVYSECMARSMDLAVAAEGGMTVMRGSAHVTLRSTVPARGVDMPIKSTSGSECVWLSCRLVASWCGIGIPLSDLSSPELRLRFLKPVVRSSTED